MKESTKRLYPAGALMLAVIALAAALTCVSGCKKQVPDVDPVPTPVPTEVAGERPCTDASGASFPHGYRYALGAQVFECQDGQFVEVK